jgi:hypothetical protein
MCISALPEGVTLQQIYSEFMGYLFKHTEPYFKKRIIDGSNIWESYKDSIAFVFGHPNGWGLREQEFLRKAAIKGGLVDAADAKNRVRFVTEAEASVHYCIGNSNILNGLQLVRRSSRLTQPIKIYVSLDHLSLRSGLILLCAMLADRLLILPSTQLRQSSRSSNSQKRERLPVGLYQHFSYIF